MKEANPNLKVCFVGPHVTTLPEKSLADGEAIDFIVRREFDYATVEYANGKPLSEILGASYRGPNGTVIHNPDRPAVSDLDALPDVVDVYKRDIDPRKYNVPFLLYPFVALYTTRGCPAQCTFCLWPQTLSGHPWRKRSTDAVAAEMKKAMEYWPWVKEFFFDDDTFNIQKARTIELCEKLKPLKMTWSCTSRVTTDYETLKAMKEAGCRLLIVGYESGDPQILKNVKKGATVERARQFTKDCKKLGLLVHGDFILGLPGETKETIRRTIDFAKELDCETIQVSVAHAYPGTELYDYAKANGFILSEGAAMVDEGGHQVAMIEYPGPAPRLRHGDGASLLRRVLLPSEGHLPHRAQSGVQQRRAQAPLRGSQAVHDAARCPQQSSQGSPQDPRQSDHGRVASRQQRPRLAPSLGRAGLLGQRSRPLSFILRGLQAVGDLFFLS